MLTQPVNSIGRLNVKTPNGELRCPTEILPQLMHDHGDVVHYETLFNEFTLFNHPEAVKEILLGHNFVRIKLIKSVLGNGVLTSDGPHWERQRRLMLPEFKTQQLEKWTQAFSKITRARVDSWKGLDLNQPLHMSRETERLALSMLGEVMFDKEIDHKFLDCFGTVMKEISSIGNSNVFGFSLQRRPGDNKRFQEAMTSLHDVVSEILEAPSNSEGCSGNLLTRLANHGKVGCPSGNGRKPATPLTEQQLRDEIITIITAGTETSAVTMAWAIYLIAKHPEKAKTFYQEIDSVLGERQITADDLQNLPYTRMVIAETLRLYPPIWLIGRKVERDDTVMGVPVATGSGVLISPYVIHRHPDFWSDPDEFIPERFAEDAESHTPYTYFPFIGGRHRCLGEHFALTEAMVVLATIAQQYKFTLPPEHPIVLDPLISLRVRDGLRVTAIPRRKNQ